MNLYESFRVRSWTWRLWYTYCRDVVGYCHLHVTSRCRHPAPGQDLIPLQRLHMFAHSRDPNPAIKLWRQVPFTNSKTICKLKCIVCSAFWKSNILKVELSIIKIGELLRKLWSLRSCFLILPPGPHTPHGIEGAMKRDVSKHWCTLQWCASRGWFIAHENWTSWQWYALYVSLYSRYINPCKQRRVWWGVTSMALCKCDKDVGKLNDFVSH